MDKSVTAALVLLFLFVMLGAMALSWWARKKRQSGYAELATVPTELGELLGEFSGLYLASTPVGEPLNRIAVRGLGFRARTTIEVFSAGLVFIGDRFVPATSITGLGESHLDSYFRLDDQEGFLRVAATLVKKTGKQ